MFCSFLLFSACQSEVSDTKANRTLTNGRIFHQYVVFAVIGWNRRE